MNNLPRVASESAAVGSWTRDLLMARTAYATEPQKCDRHLILLVPCCPIQSSVCVFVCYPHDSLLPLWNKLYKTHTLDCKFVSQRDALRFPSASGWRYRASSACITVSTDGKASILPTAICVHNDVDVGTSRNIMSPWWFDVRASWRLATGRRTRRIRKQQRLDVKCHTIANNYSTCG